MPTEFAFKNTETVQSPGGSKIPHVGFEDALWIEMQPIEVKYQTTHSQGGQIASGEARGPKFRFLAPITLQENIVHAWEAYESIQSRLANKIKGLAKVVGEIAAVGAGGLEAITATEVFGKGKGDEKRKTSLAEDAQAYITRVARGIAAPIPAYKVDTPLVYVDSNRREYNFTFTLIATENPKKEVVDIVKDLMKYSAPEVSDASWIGITLPWVFNIKSFPGEPPLLNIRHAALVAVQPTWQSPYIDGLPTRCDLTLSFKDLSPLYRSTIETGGILKIVKPKEEKPKTPEIQKNVIGKRGEKIPFDIYAVAGP